MCRWREMRACHGNVCEESKRQNFHESFLDLAFLIDATTHKWGCTKIPAKAAIGLEGGALTYYTRSFWGDTAPQGTSYTRSAPQSHPITIFIR